MEKLDVSIKTKTFTYIMPVLGVVLLPFRHNIVNAFIGDIKHPELDNHIFVLFKFIGSRDFIDYEEYLETTPGFALSYDPERKFVMKVFNVPERHEQDLQIFRDSKYSKLSDEAKARIIAFHQLPQNSPIVDVLFKRESAYKRLEAELNNYPGVSQITVDRNLEASSIIDLNREIYSPLYHIGTPIEKAKDDFIGKGL